MTVSASKISIFLQCPKRYWWEYIKRERVPSEVTVALQKGRIMHEALRIYIGGGAKEMIDALSLATKTMEVPPTPSVISDCVNSLDEWKRNYHPLGDVVGLEHEFKMDIAGIEVNGFIDKIEKKDGVYYVTDYKTGLTRYSEGDIKGSVQLVMYAMVCHETWQDCTKTIGVYDLIDQGVVVQDVIDEESIVLMHKYITEIVENMKKIIPSSSPKGNVGSSCTFCPYKFVCGEFKSYMKTELDITQENLTDLPLLSKMLSEIREKQKILKTQDEKLAAILTERMKTMGIESVNSDDFSVSLSSSKRSSYDVAAVFNMFPGDFFDVASVSTEAVNKLKKKLNPDQLMELEKAKRVTSTYPSLRVTRHDRK